MKKIIIMTILFIILMCSVAYGGRVINRTNLISYYQMEDTIDRIYNFTMAINDSPTITTGKEGLATNFTENDRYQNTTFFSPDTYNGSLSITGWFNKNTSVGAGEVAFFIMPGETGINDHLALYMDTTDIYSQFGEATRQPRAAGSLGQYLDGQWHSFAMIHGDRSLVYIDGSVIINETGNNMTNGNNRIFIGGKEGGLGDFNGSIDELAFWQIALNGTEVLTLNSTFYDFDFNIYNSSIPIVGGFDNLFSTQELTGACNATYLNENHNISYQWVWYRNGTNHSNIVGLELGATTANVTNGIMTNLTTLPSSSTDNNEDWIFSCRAYSWEDETYTAWLNSSRIKIFSPQIDNCSEFNYTVMNFTYFDRKDNTPITIQNGYNLTFGNFPESIVSGTFYNSQTDKLCTDINPLEREINWSVTGQLILEKNLYATEIFEISTINPTLTSNTDPANLTFRLTKLNESSTITFTWLSTTFAPISGTMQIYECAGDGSRTLLSSTPIVDSLAVANLELINTPYSYEVITDGQLFRDTSDYTKCHIESLTERQYIIDTGTDVSPIIGMYSIDCNLTKDGTNIVNMSWGTNPQDTSIITGCIFAQRISLGANVKLYENCTNSSNMLRRTIPDSGFAYNVYGKVFQSGHSKTCKDSLEFGVDTQAADTFGLSGIFAIILLIVGMILIFSDESPMWYPLMAAIALIGAFILGITAFGWVPVSALVAFVIIIIVVGRRNKAE